MIEIIKFTDYQMTNFMMSSIIWGGSTVPFHTELGKFLISAASEHEEPEEFEKAFHTSVPYALRELPIDVLFDLITIKFRN